MPQFCFLPVNFSSMHPAVIIYLAWITNIAIVVENTKGIAVVEEWNPTK